MKKGIIVAVMMMMANTAQGICSDPADCYCRLTPSANESLVYAEVTASTSGSVDIKLLEDPFQDPGGELHVGDDLTGIGNADFTLDVQDKGLFRLTMDAAPAVAAVVVGEGELFPCDMDPGFSGAAIEDVVDAVLAHDCHLAVVQLGVSTDCNDTVESCAACGPTRRGGTAGSWFLMLSFLTIFLVRLKASGGAE